MNESRSLVGRAVSKSEHAIATPLGENRAKAKG
jgi:hypothetical protein